MPPRSLRTFRLPLALGLAIACFWGALALGGMLDRPQWFFYNTLFAWRGALAVPQNVLIVAIDEESMQDLGAWPPPRTVYAELVDGLLGAGARVVGLDVVFPQAQSAATDRAFAAALARHPGRVVLAANFQPVVNGQAEGEELLPPIAPLRGHAFLGFVNFLFDADGGLHRFIPYHAIDLAGPGLSGQLPSFDVAVARAATSRPLPAWLERGDPPLINFVGPPGRVPSRSLSVMLDAIRHQRADRLAAVRDRVVLVGATSLRLQDQYPTPFSAQNAAMYMPGVEIHANAIHTILADDPIRRVPPGLAFFEMLAVALGAAWALARVSPGWGAGAALALAAGLVGLSYGLFSAARLWLDVTTSLFAIATLYPAAVVGHFVRAESARRFYRRTFESYVSPDIVEEVLRNPGLAPKLGGERREVTVLFSDIRSFTTISERLSPEQVVEFLNAYLTAMADIILESGGCIDKYIGDAILAVWGNIKPLAPEDAACRAVGTALAMKNRVDALRETWRLSGFPAIDIGVGVNTGEAIVGNIGSPRKLEFAVIGDSINVASRLEGLTKEYGGVVLVSQRTRDLLGDRFECHPLGQVKVKGREAAVSIFGVVGETGPVTRAESGPG